MADGGMIVAPVDAQCVGMTCGTGLATGPGGIRRYVESGLIERPMSMSHTAVQRVDKADRPAAIEEYLSVLREAERQARASVKKKIEVRQ